MENIPNPSDTDEMTADATYNPKALVFDELGLKKTTFLKNWTFKHTTWINVCIYVPSLLIMLCYHYFTIFFFFFLKLVLSNLCGT